MLFEASGFTPEARDLWKVAVFFGSGASRRVSGSAGLVCL